MARTPLSVILYARGSVNDLAERAGISASFLSAIKNGHREAPEATLRAIAKAAGLDWASVEAAYLATRSRALKASLEAIRERQSRLRHPA